jgi:hypothetical protein
MAKILQQSGQQNTAFSADADIVCQFTGTGNGAPGYNGPSAYGSGFIPVLAANVDVTPFLLHSRFVQIACDGNTTCNISSNFVPPAGAMCFFKFYQANTYANANSNMTFKTGFRANALIAPSSSGTVQIGFISDATYWVEAFRSLAISGFNA